MFKHILFPTDGAATSKHVIKECVAFAKDTGAMITALHVMPRYTPLANQVDIDGNSLEQFRRECVMAAEEFLEEIVVEARAAHVPCNPIHVTSDYPYDAIIRTAEERHCDLIAMASHGRKGVKGMILGSETQKVLTHTKLPVLVFRGLT
ncbi:MAG TPA: universal stress protein [Burkholderiaceae bacterium]